MLLENYIKLLLEAPQIKLGDLQKYPGKLLIGKNYQSYWEFANVEFRGFNANEDLSKRGPFFNCIKLCFDEFLSYENDPTYDVAENIRAMVVYINGLYDFRNNPEVNKIYTAFIADGYNGFEELREAYYKVFQHIGPKNLNNFNNPTYVNMLKTSQTEYLFDTPDRMMDGLLAVVPTTTASSIFWARTNAYAQQIILTKLDRERHEGEPDFLTWCTSFPDESNMFHSYYVNGGTSMFYFLPVDDVNGLNKFCIGVTKVRDGRSDDPDDFSLLCGGHTTVGFENKAFIPDGSDFTDDDVKEMMLNKFGSLGLTEEMLEIIQEKVSGRNPFDKYAYVGNLRPAEFAASVNMNTIGASEDGRNSIKQQIETILSTYKDPEFLKDYQPNPKIIQIINKDIRYWTECKVNVIYIPEKFGSNPEFWTNRVIDAANATSKGYRRNLEVKNSIKNFIDWNFVNRPNVVTVDFIIDFLETCFDKAVQSGNYSSENPKSRYNRYMEEMIKANNEGNRVDYKDEYGFSYDKIALDLKMSLVPVEALMTWSSADLIKFFRYIEKVKNNYPGDIVPEHNLNQSEHTVRDYFIRKLNIKSQDDEDDQQYSDAEYRSIKIFCSQLLKNLFSNYNDFENFCDKEGRTELQGRSEASRFYVTDFFMFDNSDYGRFEPFLIPQEWLTPEIIKDVVLTNDTSRVNHVLKMLKDNSEYSENQFYDLGIKIGNVAQFKKDNALIIPQAIANFLKTEMEYIFEEYNNTGDANIILQSREIRYIENILKEHADIIQKLQQTDLNNPESDFAKFSKLYQNVENLRNRGLEADTFESFITEGAKHCGHLIQNEPKEVGVFGEKFLNHLKYKLENDSSLVTFENSFFMANEFKKYDAEILNASQHFFWCLYEQTATVNPQDWIKFFCEIFEGDRPFALMNWQSYSDDLDHIMGKLRRIKAGASNIQELKSMIVRPDTISRFVGARQFKSIMESFETYAKRSEREELFFETILQSLSKIYPDEKFVDICDLFFKKYDYLIYKVEDYLENVYTLPNQMKLLRRFKSFNSEFNSTKYDQRIENIRRERLRQKKLAQGINDEDDDSIEESKKFKIGNKILSERQFRKLIRHLL